MLSRNIKAQLLSSLRSRHNLIDFEVNKHKGQCYTDTVRFLKKLTDSLKSKKYNEADCHDTDNYAFDGRLYLNSVDDYNNSNIEGDLFFAINHSKKHLTIFNGEKDLLGNTQIYGYPEIYKILQNKDTYCAACGDPGSCKEHDVVGEKILGMSVVSFDNKGKTYFYSQSGLHETDIKYFTAVKLKKSKLSKILSPDFNFEITFTSRRYKFDEFEDKDKSFLMFRDYGFYC